MFLSLLSLIFAASQDETNMSVEQNSESMEIQSEEESMEVQSEEELMEIEPGKKQHRQRLNKRPNQKTHRTKKR